MSDRHQQSCFASVVLLVYLLKRYMCVIRLFLSSPKRGCKAFPFLFVMFTYISLFTLKFMCVGLWVTDEEYAQRELKKLLKMIKMSFNWQSRIEI